METFKTDTCDYQIAIDKTDNKDDMKHVMNEFKQYDYKLIHEMEHEGNTIVIYAKKL